MGKIIGIDLGTTNSCVAVMEGGKPVVIPNAEGSRTTPSVVAFTKTGERLVGDMAKRQAVTNASRTVSSIKRHMGTDYKVSIDGKEYTPQEISSMILQKLKSDAESYLGEEVTEAVITVPAYFDDSQRQATKDAGRIAGLNVRRIINEPTAAALAYGLDEEQKQKVMVYDLGGGTFDVSIIEIGDGVVEVLSTNGDTHLGGDDYDRCVSDWIVQEFLKQEGIDLSADATAMQRVKEAAEKTKKELSSASTSNINLPFIAMNETGPKNLDLTLSRSKFESLTSSLTEKTGLPVRNAMMDAGLDYPDLGKVLMVGGSTRMITAQEKVKSLTGKDPSKELNPDECVAIGAAIQGGKLAGEAGSRSIVLLDITPLTLSIEVMGGVCEPIIPRNTTIPIKESKIFATAFDNQTEIELKVLQGERKFAEDNKLLGKFLFTGMLPAKKGVGKIEVSFDIDANGILKVSARDLATGKEQHMVVTASSNMSSADIGQAIREAEKYAEQDAIRKASVEYYNNAEKIVDGVKQALKEVKNQLSEARSSRLEGMIKDIEDYAEAHPIDKITPEIGQTMNEKSEALSDESQKIFGALYGYGYEEEDSQS